jgi:hypothetical protein
MTYTKRFFMGKKKRPKFARVQENKTQKSKSSDFNDKFHLGS